jgi:hypothetical protein
MGMQLLGQVDPFFGMGKWGIGIAVHVEAWVR